LVDNQMASPDEWLAARRRLLKRERELNQLIDELGQARRELPWLPVTKEYRFEGDRGAISLSDLFDGRSMLIVYHIMFGPDWTAACPGCSNLVDEFNHQLVHLNHHDVSLVCVSHAPIEKLLAYKQRMGWTMPYVSALHSDFNFDFGVSFTSSQVRSGATYNFEPFDFQQEIESAKGNELVADAAASCGTTVADYVTSEKPGLSVFVQQDGVVYRTYSAYAPDASMNLRFAELLERTPVGEAAVRAIRRRDEYPPGPRSVQ